MNFISTKNLTNENAPKGEVLVQYLEPSWGSFYVNFAIAYFDNPIDYENPENGNGWKLWNNSKQINVIAYAELPTPIESKYTKLRQKEFIEKNGMFPCLGNVGE